MKHASSLRRATKRETESKRPGCRIGRSLPNGKIPSAVPPEGPHRRLSLPGIGKRTLLAAVFAAVQMVPEAGAAPPETRSVSLKQSDDLNISRMYSGMPKAKKPSKAFNLADYREYVSDAKRALSPSLLRSHERDISYVVQGLVSEGHVRSLAALLEAGFDINMRPLPDMTMLQLLLQKLEYGDETESLNIRIKTFLYLLENGIDVNAPAKNPPVETLLRICGKKGKRHLWSLIPVMAAYGANIDQKMIGKIRNGELEKYVRAVAAKRPSIPTPAVENRLQVYAKLPETLKLPLPKGKKTVRVLWTDVETPFFNSRNRRRYYRPLKLQDFKEMLCAGLSPDALLLPHESSLLSLAGTDDFDAHALLLANGARLGTERVLVRRVSRRLRLLHWEFGADINACDVNRASNKDDWRFLHDLYHRQWCQFDRERLLKRSDAVWDLLAAVLKNDLSGAEKAIAAGANVNYCDDSFAPVLLRIADKGGAQEMIRLLLKKGADPNLTWKIDNFTLFHCRSRAIDRALRAGKRENALLMRTLGKAELKPIIHTYSYGEYYKDCTAGCRQLEDFPRGRNAAAALDYLDFIIDTCGCKTEHLKRHLTPEFLAERLGKEPERGKLFLEWCLKRGMKPDSATIDKAVAACRKAKGGQREAWALYLESLKKK